MGEGGGWSEQPPPEPPKTSNLRKSRPIAPTHVRPKGGRPEGCVRGAAWGRLRQRETELARVRFKEGKDQTVAHRARK